MVARDCNFNMREAKGKGQLFRRQLRAWQYMHLNLALYKQRRAEFCEFGANLVYIMRLRIAMAT